MSQSVGWLLSQSVSQGTRKIIKSLCLRTMSWSSIGQWR